MNDKTCIDERYWKAAAALPVFLHHQAEGTLGRLIKVTEGFQYGSAQGGQWNLSMKLDGSNWTDIRFNTGNVEQSSQAYNEKKPDFKPQLSMCMYPYKYIIKNQDNERSLKEGTTENDAYPIARIMKIIDNYVFETLVPDMISKKMIFTEKPPTKELKKLEKEMAGKFVVGTNSKLCRSVRGDDVMYVSFPIRTEESVSKKTGAVTKEKTKFLLKKSASEKAIKVPSSDVDKGPILNTYLPIGSKTISNVLIGGISISAQGISLNREAIKIQVTPPPPKDNDDEMPDDSDDDNGNGNAACNEQQTESDDDGNISPTD